MKNCISAFGSERGVPLCGTLKPVHVHVRGRDFCRQNNVCVCVCVKHVSADLLCAVLRELCGALREHIRNQVEAGSSTDGFSIHVLNGKTFSRVAGAHQVLN